VAKSCGEKKIMKTRLLLIVASVLCASFSALADLPEFPKGLGLHTGLNLADVSMSSDVSTSSTLGYVLGGTYDVPLAPDFSFLPGAQLVQRGFGFDVGTTEVDLKMTYLEFPLMFQARFTGASVIPFVMGGPVVGVKLSTSCSVAGGDCTVTNDQKVKTLEMGLELGGGVIFPLANGAGLSLLARYHLGLTKVIDNDSNPHHRGLLMEVGYLF
jgi:hypothetical protein